MGTKCAERRQQKFVTASKFSVEFRHVSTRFDFSGCTLLGIFRTLFYLLQIERRIYKDTPRSKAEIKTFHATLTISRDISLMSIYPHMHLLGKSWDIYAIDPHGNRINLISISDWDFNWQGSYTFTHFQKIPAGSQIHASVTYDNTTDNLLNPNNPPRNMTWGEKTTDEMLIAAMGYVLYREGDEHIALTIDPGETTSIDFNGDGNQDFIDFVLFAQNYGTRRGEASYQTHFDLNQNGQIDFADFLLLARIFGQ